MSRPLIVNDQVRIPAAEISLSFARSAGPGGQNVNKVNSKAVLKWNVAASSSISDEVKSRFFSRFANRINQHGDLVVASDRFREQPRNVSECYDRLRQLLQSVLEPPRKRIKTKPSRASIERRLQAKRQSSQRKQSRRYRPDPEN